MSFVRKLPSLTDIVHFALLADTVSANRPPATVTFTRPTPSPLIYRDRFSGKIDVGTAI